MKEKIASKCKGELQANIRSENEKEKKKKKNDGLKKTLLLIIQ